MLAFASAWVGLGSLLIAVTMVVYRPAFTDLGVTLVLWFGSPAAMCFGILVLWAHRKDDTADAGLQAQRLQCKVGIVLAVVAAAIVYLLIIYSQKIVPPTA